MANVIQCKLYILLLLKDRHDIKLHIHHKSAVFTSSGQNVVGVVLLSLLIRGGSNIQDGGSRHPVGGKASFRLGLT